MNEPCNQSVISLPLERVDVEADLGLLLGGHRVEAEPLEGLQLPFVIVDLAVVQVHVGRRGEHAFCCWREIQCNMERITYTIRQKISSARIICTWGHWWSWTWVGFT